MKIVARIICLAALLCVIGCKSRIGSNDRTTNLRVFNAVPDVESLDFFLDSKSLISSVGYLENSDYSSEDTGSHKVSVSVSGSFTPLVDTTRGFADATDYTLFVVGLSTKASAVFSSDDNTPAGKDTTKIRAFNAASGSKGYDFYVVPGTQDIESVVPTIKSLGFKSVSNYISSSKGTYSVVVTQKNSKEILAAKTSVQFKGDSVYTILVSDSGQGDELPKILVLKDHED